jgi:hypothetical protein
VFLICQQPPGDINESKSTSSPTLPEFRSTKRCDNLDIT